MANIQLASQEWVSEQLSGQTSILTLKKSLLVMILLLNYQD